MDATIPIDAKMFALQFEFPRLILIPWGRHSMLYGCLEGLLQESRSNYQIENALGLRLVMNQLRARSRKGVVLCFV